MDADSQLGEFLRARRELARPADLGLPDSGRRRVPGLRREEVAMLAGVSTDYYVRLEQGRERHPSDEVLTALAGVLGLDEDALAHLRQLAAPRPRRRRAQPRPERASPGLLSLLGQWPDTPAFVMNRFRDVLACTALAAALHPGLDRDRNMVRLLFLDPAERDLYPEWDRVARDSVAWLRAAAGADLGHPRLTEVVGELTVKSPEFARLWSRHEVREKSSGAKRLVHPVTGEIALDFETFAVGARQGQSLTVYHAAPGSRAADALSLLASHAATSAQDSTGVVVFHDYAERTAVTPAAPRTSAPPATPPRS
jgi:transcriptional regulator with XRE-family HTH domain